jgi:hypothetical protein
MPKPYSLTTASWASDALTGEMGVVSQFEFPLPIPASHPCDQRPCDAATSNSDGLPARRDDHIGDAKFKHDPTRQRAPE